MTYFSAEVTRAPPAARQARVEPLPGELVDVERAGERQHPREADEEREELAPGEVRADVPVEDDRVDEPSARRMARKLTGMRTTPKSA